MFGKRSDGTLVKDMDPIVALTPYLMPMRCDAQVFLDVKLPYETLARYIVEQGHKGYHISFMEILIAAFVRTVSELPEINRFIANKRLYARKYISVSFTVLQNTEGDDIAENAVKCYFDPYDTIYDVAENVNRETEKNRLPETDSSVLKLAKILLKPVLANTVVFLCRTLDRFGIMPRALLDLSPFHTSIWITNVASIGLPAVKHHIYNFGTTSMFWSIGVPEKSATVGKEGKAERVRKLPLGVNIDERICAGAIYAKMMERLVYYTTHPEELEKKPEKVRVDVCGPITVPKQQ